MMVRPDGLRADARAPSAPRGGHAGPWGGPAARHAASNSGAPVAVGGHGKAVRLQARC